MTTPAHLRDLALTAQEHHADPRLILAVDADIEEFPSVGRPNSADDIRPLVPTLALPLVGGRVRSYLMRRNPQRLVCVGEVRSEWPATHHKKIGLYVGAEHHEAGAA
jgi:hypothetical protein